MAESHAERPATVALALGRLRVSLDDAFARAGRSLGLTAQQAELLCAAMSPVAIGELAISLRCDRSNVSRLVDRGSLRGLMRRREGEEDGRVTLVELTPSGADLAVRFLAELEAQTKQFVEQWPAARRRLAVEALNEIADVLDASQPARPQRRRSRGPAPT